MIFGPGTRWEDLPEAIRAHLTKREWDWLPDDEKMRYIEHEIQPDVEDRP